MFTYVCPRERREAPLLFEACIALLGSCFSKLHAELDRQMGEHYATAVNNSSWGAPEDDGAGIHTEPEYDMTLGVRLAEAAAQAMWGSANSCSTSCISPMPFNMAHVQQLAEMAEGCLDTDALPLSRICHCITATLATLASAAETAELLMACPGDLALKTLLRLSLVQVWVWRAMARGGRGLRPEGGEGAGGRGGHLGSEDVILPTYSITLSCRSRITSSRQDTSRPAPAPPSHSWHATRSARKATTACSARTARSFWTRGHSA